LGHLQKRLYALQQNMWEDFARHGKEGDGSVTATFILRSLIFVQRDNNPRVLETTLAKPGACSRQDISVVFEARLLFKYLCYLNQTHCDGRVCPLALELSENDTLLYATHLLTRLWDLDLTPNSSFSYFGSQTISVQCFLILTFADCVFLFIIRPNSVML